MSSAINKLINHLSDVDATFIINTANGEQLKKMFRNCRFSRKLRYYPYIIIVRAFFKHNQIQTIILLFTQVC